MVSTHFATCQTRRKPPPRCQPSGPLALPGWAQSWGWQSESQLLEWQPPADKQMSPGKTFAAESSMMLCSPTLIGVVRCMCRETSAWWELLPPAALSAGSLMSRHCQPESGQKRRRTPSWLRLGGWSARQPCGPTGRRLLENLVCPPACRTMRMVIRRGCEMSFSAVGGMVDGGCKREEKRWAVSSTTMWFNESFADLVC